MDINNAIKKYDKSDYLNFLENFDKQIQEASNISLPDIPACKYDHVAVLGMGGSAISGEIAKCTYSLKMLYPISVVRSYDLPASVTENTLVIASSYSGNTEETLSAVKQALRQKCTIVCLTTGGELFRVATDNKLPVITLPKGYQPRAAVGLSLIPLLKVLHKISALVGVDINSEITASMKLMSSLHDQFSKVEPDSNPTLQLAMELKDKFPVIYTGSLSALGTRWCGQFAENAKVLSICNNLPELNHNEIMGWDPSFTFLKNAYVVFLRDSQDHPRIQARFDITKKIIADYAFDHCEVWSSGKTALERVLSLLYFGDYASYYLALFNKKDPTTIENINYLKAELAKI